MDHAVIRERLKRHWEDESRDPDASHEIYHEHAVLEFPQSQERFEGKSNFLSWRKRYPAVVEFKVRRIRGQGHLLWVAELSIRYNGGPWHYGCSILELEGDKVARETIYLGEGWEAPEWRAPWRAEWREESLG